ncbi:response regulator transcription factor [Streptomyces sp. Tu 3180]|nr:response regulator transcription factor [Streptomyces sp. Tu 3180]
MVTPAPTTPLTPAEQGITQHVAGGLSAREIADATQLSSSTTHSYLRIMRGKLRSPERCTLTVVAHRLIASGEAAVPHRTCPRPHSVTRGWSFCEPSPSAVDRSTSHRQQSSPPRTFASRSTSSSRMQVPPTPPSWSPAAHARVSSGS